MDPQSLETPMEQTTVQTNGICRTKLNTGTQMFSTSTFPKLENVATHNIRRHYPRNMQDVCFKSLQYSVNKSIPKFELYRYFLNFKLGERITKTNLKHRLLNVAGTFNAEMFDISIVMPVYVPDSDGAAVSCELLELWQHSDDIYKILVRDTYKIVERLKKLPTFSAIGDRGPTFNVLPVFINSIEIQLKDLKQAVIDTIIQNKPEKIPKRVRRLRLLQYTKLISPFYTKDPIKDLLIANDISELDIQIPDSFLDILTVDKSSIYNAEYIHKRKHIRVLYEYYISAMNSEFYKRCGEQIRIVSSVSGSIELTLQDFLKQFLNLFWRTFDGEVLNPVFRSYVLENFGTPNNTSFSHINTILRIQEIMREFFLGSDSELIQFTDGETYEFGFSEEWKRKDFSEMFGFEIAYKQITIKVPADKFDSVL
jgi:hypothetical protein